MENLLKYIISLALATTVKTVNTVPVPANSTNNNSTCSNNTHNVNHKYYTIDKEIKISGIPADMSVLWKTGDIYFTSVVQMKMGLYQLKPTGEIIPLKVEGTGQTTACDNTNNVVYLGSDKGVFKYHDNGTISLYTGKDEDVMYLAVTEDGGTMYLATFPQNRVTKITNHGTWYRRFHQIPNGKNIAVDHSGNIYFVATKITYVLKNGEKIPIKIEGLPDDEIVAIFVAKTKEVYAMDQTSALYLIDGDNAKAKSLGSFGVDKVNSFALDANNNVLIGVQDFIYRYKGYNKKPCL